MTHTNYPAKTSQELSLQQEELMVLAKKAKRYSDNALSAKTQRFYKDDWLIFDKWAGSQGFLSLPAKPEAIVLFLTAQAETAVTHHGKAIFLRPTTLIRRLAAIRHKHEEVGCDSPTQHKQVRQVLNGIKRKYGMAIQKKAPATAERIASMIANCPDTLTGLRDKALILLGFAGAFRRSELVALTMNDIERTPEGIKITIRKSKTDQEGQGQMIAILNGIRFRVVDALYAWLNAANINNGYLFRPIKKGGLIQPRALTDRSVANIVKLYAGKAGLTVNNFSGHSLRSGFITSGAQAGADLFKLMEVSRHKKPETVIGYVRESKLFEDHAGEKFL